ncbi:diguanylate cyclase domain-containing protein [Marinobacter sp.]|uniref:diguanylate cyclase domain-containing protein n=1 Tax=Marinobacter sp. TaxID=50741 RepID=UPI0035619CA2
MKSIIPLESFVDLLLDALCVVDREGIIRYVSSASERVFGYRPKEMVGRPILDFVHPDDQQKTADTVVEILRGDQKLNFENRYIRKDGSIAHIMWSARWSEDKKVRVALARDVTERKHAEARQEAIYAISEAAHRAESLSALFERIHKIVDDLLIAPAFTVALKAVESDTLNVLYNADRIEAGMSRTDYDAGSLCAQVVQASGAVAVGHDCLGVPLVSSEGVFGAILLQRPAESISFSDKDRGVLEFVGEQIAAAIERKKMHSQLEYMASYDQLTGLPNRHLVLDRMQNALTRVAREQGVLAVLYLDVDNFKEVNDTYGHGVGDEVLSFIATRLSDSVRASDTVGRLGGDEFVVLLDTIKHPSDAVLIAEKIFSSLSKPYELSVATLNLFPSIGVAFYPDHGEDLETLLSYADSAMYLEKKSKA